MDAAAERDDDRDSMYECRDDMPDRSSAQAHQHNKAIVDLLLPCWQTRMHNAYPLCSSTFVLDHLRSENHA